MNTEIVELKDFPGYGVDREGNVYSLERVVLRAAHGKLSLPLRKMCPYVSGSGYPIVSLRIEEKKFSKRVHRLVAMAFLDLQSGQDVDHINRDRTDNRLENLRTATRSQNLCNSPARRNGLKGTRPKGNRWQAQITINGKAAHLGSYTTEAEAHAAYCKAAKELHGEFYYGSK